MQEQKQDTEQIRITRAAMEEELGDSYKRCWAVAFKYANEELGFDEQVENLCREFDILRPWAVWFVNGASTILLQKEAKENRSILAKDKQRELVEYSGHIDAKQTEKYVSELEMMSFLEDVEEMCGDPDFMEYWAELGKIKQTVLEQYCATEKEVLSVFYIRSKVDRSKEEDERFFDAYPVSTDAWENGHFDKAGEIVY